MVAKTLFVVCASALFIQSISAQCIGYNSAGATNLAANAAAANAANLAVNAAAARPWAGLGCGGAQAAIANGGGLTVSSTSPLAPTGVTVVSDNAIEGPLEIAGQLPVLSAVTLEGQIPTGGAAGTSYSCGNGEVSISADSLATAGVGVDNVGLIGNGLNGINAGFNGINAGLNGIGAGFNGIGAGFNGIGAGFNGIGAGFNGIGAGCNGIGAGIANAGLRNAGIGNAGLANGLNAGLAGARLNRPGCGSIC